MRRLRSAAVTILVIVTAMTGLHLARATSLGGLTATSLAGINQTATSGAPAIITCDDFSRAAATGSALASRPVQLTASCGTATWTANLGTWTITSGQLAATTANATATLNAGQTSISAEATILNANGTSRVAGIAIDHTGSTRIYLVGALSGPGTAQLLLVNGSTVTTLASAAVTIGATAVVRITRNSSAVTVSVNGTLALSFTLTSTQITTLSGGTKVGLYWGSGSTIKFTNLMATQPASP